MSSSWKNSTRSGLVRTRLALGGLALILLAALALAPIAAAETSPAETEGPVYEAPTPEPMTVTFAAKTAKLSGPGAIVTVRCTGSTSGSCDGTLSLRIGGTVQKAPYTIASGERRIVVVPLVDAAERRARRGVRTVFGVTRTMQPLGGLVRSAQQLHLR